LTIKKPFKPGDVVEALLSSHGGSYIKGNTYVVKAHSQVWHSVETEKDENGSTTNGWDAKNFKLVVPKTPKKPKTSSLQTQIGGSHYTDMPIQPIEYILANNIPFPEGNVIKYVSRWRAKGGVKDLEKAVHHLKLLIEHESTKGAL
jgi:hypothetical protein